MTLFDNIPRINMRDSIQMTADTLNMYRQRFSKWSIAWSGGKDSTATVTLIVYLIENGMVKAPDRQGWTGHEMSAALLHDEIRSDGSIQPVMFKDFFNPPPSKTPPSAP